MRTCGRQLWLSNHRGHLKIWSISWTSECLGLFTGVVRFRLPVYAQALDSCVWAGHGAILSRAIEEVY